MSNQPLLLTEALTCTLSAVIDMHDDFWSAQIAKATELNQTSYL